MLAFAIPPLALLTVLSLSRSIHANWAATTALVDDDPRGRLVAEKRLEARHSPQRWGSDCCVQAAAARRRRLRLSAFDTGAGPAGRPVPANARMARARAIASPHSRAPTGAKTVAVEGRAEVAALVYYLRNEPLPVLSWPANEDPRQSIRHDARARRFRAGAGAGHQRLPVRLAVRGLLPAGETARPVRGRVRPDDQTPIPCFPAGRPQALDRADRAVR